VLDYQIKYKESNITAKSHLIEVSPPYGREDPIFMNAWYNITATAESNFNYLLVEKALGTVTSHDVTIAEARAALARCLTSDVQILKATCAISSVNAKVARKEKLSRENKIVKDRLSNRERANKRRGIPNAAPEPIPVRPSAKSFLPRGAPKQGRTPTNQILSRQSPQATTSRPPREPRLNPTGNRRAPARERDERTPRPRASERTQVRDSPSLRPEQSN
jgi:hypothetical protein